MSILQSELGFFKAATVGDSGTNGGRMSANVITSGAVANVFQAVGEAERTAGSTKYRKVFPKNGNDSQLNLSAPKVYLDQYTPGDDRIVFFVGTQTNLQSDITGSEKKYGAGKLNANVSGGATQVVVLVEDGPTQFFQNGDLIRVTDKTDINDLSGNEEYVTISGTPGVAGNLVTITFAPALVNGYGASNTRVMNVYQPSSDVVASYASLVVTSSAGTFNGTYLLPNNIGGIEQNWTLTFTSATVFNIVGDTVGSVGSGSIGAGAAPNNPDFSKPYFTMQATGFGGTFQSGDTITFTTHPANVPVWLQRIVPAGATALSNNSAVIVLDGETV